MHWYLRVLSTWSGEGRAGLRELWVFLLIDVFVILALGTVDHMWGLTRGPHRSRRFCLSMYALVVAFPTLGVQVRRLHDIGKSGWNLLVAFIPIIGAILLLYWYAQDGTPGENA